MFHPYTLKSVRNYSDVLRYVNSICHKYYNYYNQFQTIIDIDFNELVSPYQDNRLKLPSGNIHYPPPQEIRKARIRSYGLCQCKRQSVKDGLCVRHSKQLQNCIVANCKRGMNGLGACCHKD